MSLLKGAGNSGEIKIKCTARLRLTEPNTFAEVKFLGVFRHPSDMEELRNTSEKLLKASQASESSLGDDDDQEGESYNDQQLVDDYFIRFEEMPLGDNVPDDYRDGAYLKFCNETKTEVLANRYYFEAIAKGAGQVVFGAVKRKN